MLVGARKVLATVGLDVPAETRLGTLRTSEQQLVEIARALSLDARVLIMDEPTAALSQREVERLFTVVADLRLHGVAMMFVGHRMDEIFRIADRIAVLRDGRLIGVKPKAELGRAAAISMMVGREVTDLYPERRHAVGALVLEARGLSRAGGFSNIDLKLHAGEVLGLGGLVGSGRTEIARVLFGIDQPDAGEILIDGRQVRFASARDAMDARIAYVSEDRMGQSLVMDFSILDNAVLPVLDKAARAGPLRHGSRDRSGLGLAEAHEAALFRVRAAGQGTVRRQPAESGAGQMAAHRAARPHPRRADARHRCRHQGGSARDDRRPCRTRHGDHPDLLRDARAHRHVRPHRRPARRPPDGRIRERRSHPGKGAGSGDEDRANTPTRRRRRSVPLARRRRRDRSMF